MNNRKTKVLLIFSGLILLSVGAGILFWPHEFYKSNGTILGNEPGLLSEIRAGGGLLFGAGIFVFFSVFRSKLHHQALRLSALVYITFGIARLASIVFDGVPSTSLVVSTGIELLVGTLCILALRQFHINTTT
ncbi:MAG: DUF4345 domain-containing protein [Calditrichaeota bacterium]|nr:MAG: DUF4345 domain-containing protein [Calditrichota bacterium]